VPSCAVSPWRYRHGACRREFVCDPPQPNMIGVKHRPSL
jgi:hypothetical protein